MIVCHCASVNDRRIRALVGEGAEDLLAVASACGAGSFCGGCAPVLASLLAEETGAPATSFLQEAPTTAGPEPGPLRKRAEAVVRDLLEEIAAAGWPVGRPLSSDAELADRYEVTPGTVREAVRLLTHHGLIESEDGTLVIGAPTPSTIGEAAAIHLHHVGVGLAEVVQVRRALEMTMVRRAAESRDEELRSQLRTFADPTAEPPRRESGRHVEFHLLLAALSANPAFGLLVDALIRLARDLAPTESRSALEQRGLRTGREHAAIADAVLAGDGERASRAMGAHLDSFYSPMSVQATPDTEIATRRRAHEDERPAAALARAIAFDIRASGMAAGTLIGTERELAQRYRSTRTELRQAASLLELYAVAYPRVGPRGGLVVGQPDMWGVAQLMARYFDFADVKHKDTAEVRYALEPMAVALATERLGVADGERLRRRLAEEVLANHRLPIGPHGFHNIHPLIAELSGNRVMALFTAALILTLVRRVSSKTPPAALAAREREVAAVHADIVDAMIAGDHDLARQRMVAHLEEDIALAERGARGSPPRPAPPPDPA